MDAKDTVIGIFRELTKNMIIKESNIFKTSGNKLLAYLLKVMSDNTHSIMNVSLKEEKCLEIMDDIVLKMNETIYFSDDAPDDDVVESWECCRIKLCELASILRENMEELNVVTDDLETSRFLIDCNKEENLYEL